MKNRDVLSSHFWVAVGIVFVLGALQQGLLRRGVPGPGFLPFISGTLLIGLSLLVLILAIVNKKDGGKEGEDTRFFPERSSLKKFLLALAALITYTVLLEYLGYLITTFLFMFSLMRLIEAKPLKVVLIIASTTAILSYVLFVIVLGLQFPKGKLGI